MSWGKRVADTVEHPIIRPSLNSVGLTYELAQDPLYEDLATATSHLTGHKINGFATFIRASRISSRNPSFCVSAARRRRPVSALRRVGRDEQPFGHHL
jgi:hypothetical protein